MILDILTFIVSVLALISSIQIGRKQYELSKWQAEAQNKVELYFADAADYAEKCRRYTARSNVCLQFISEMWAAM